MRKCLVLLVLVLASCSSAEPVTVANTHEHRIDTNGGVIDAHEGSIIYANGRYILYGNRYGCSWTWYGPEPWCGFQAYSSTDLVKWRPEGLLFDPAPWQEWCGVGTGGCFNARMVYNAKTRRYVLWFHSYAAPSSYAVLTSKSATGPFEPEPFPRLSVNARDGKVPLHEHRNGAGDLLVDEDGTGYVAFNEWPRGYLETGFIVVEKLTPDYLRSAGQVARFVATQAEAPSMFRHGDLYYLTYSDPGCAWCGGTGTAYFSAPSPAGPWQPGGRISELSCDGQPASAVATLPTRQGSVHLFMSDQWTNLIVPRPANWHGAMDLEVMGQKNQREATQHWEPLRFQADGRIMPVECVRTFQFDPVSHLWSK